MTTICTTRLRNARAMRPQSASGFTLVEIAIVVVIVSVLLTLGITALNAQITNTAISATKKKQSTIQDSLTTYLGLHGQLPCPDTDYAVAPDGIENRANGGSPAVVPNTTLVCLNNYGIIPYVTLGLPQEAAVDGWDNFFTYYVSNAVAANADWTLTTNFHMGNVGAFNVWSTTGITTPLASTAVRTGAVVVIVSHGRNGNGAVTVQGTFNTPPPTTNDEYLNTVACKSALGNPALCTAVDFWKRDSTDSTTAPGGPFDDIVLYLEPSDLLTPLTKDGTFQGPVGVTKQTLSTLSDQMIGAMIASSVAVPSLTNSPTFMAQLNPTLVSLVPDTYTIPGTLDAWGNPVRLILGSAPPLPPVQIGFPYYLHFNSNINLLCNQFATAYTLASNGPDGLPNTADDVSLSVSVGTVIKILTAGSVAMTGTQCGS
jgi:prepilin-type N-terminal cleavage/methylation domain-containing protein